MRSGVLESDVRSGAVQIIYEVRSGYGTPHRTLMCGAVRCGGFEFDIKYVWVWSGL